MSLSTFRRQSRYLLFSLLFLLAACDLPTRSIVHHEQAIDSDRNLISDGEEELQFPHHLLRLDSEGDDPRFVVNEYQSFLVDRDQLIAQYKTNQEETRDLIQKWYENILKLENSESEVEFVIETLLYNCTTRANDCPLLPALASSPLFGLVLEKWVEKSQSQLDSEEKVIRFYTVLHLYLERRSRDVNKSLFFSYLMNIRKLENLFASTGRDRLALVNREAFNELTAEILVLFLKNGSEEEIVNLVQELNVFNLSRDDLRDPLSRLIFQKGLELGLYIENEINPAVSAAIESRRSQTDSFESRLNTIISKYPLMVSNLELQRSIPRNEYFWIIDSLFYNRLGIDEANWIWQASQKSLSDFNSVSYEYLKIQLAHLIASTNEKQAQVYTDDSLAKSEIIEEAIRASELSTVKVLSFLAQVDRIRGFSESTGALREIEGLDNRGVKAFFNYLKENIKFLISYNHHLMAVYYISKRQLESRVKVGGISATTGKYLSMIRTFRDDHLRKFPLLFKYGVTTDNYSAGEEKLNFYQLAYVFDFALKTLSFDQLGIDPVDYIKIFYEVVIESRLQKLLEKEDFSIKRHFNNSYYQEFLSFCEAVKGVGGYKAEATLTSFAYKPTLGVFAYALPAQSPRGDGQKALNPYAITMAEELEAYKLIILRDIQFADALSINLKEYLQEKQGLSEDEVNQRFRAVESRRSAAMEQMNQFVSNVGLLANNYNECYAQAITNDKEVMTSILKNEIEHIRRVHRAMVEIRRGGSPDLSFLSFSGYPNSFDGYDQLTSDYYLYHKFDLLIRAKEHMEGISDYARVKIPRDFARDGETRSLYTERQNQRISFKEDEDEFIRSVLQATNQFVLWLEDSHMNSMIFPLRDTYMSLNAAQRLFYHLGRESEIPAQLTAQSMIDHVVRLKDYISMSDDLKEILTYYGRDTLFEIEQHSSLVNILLNDESLYPEPYFYWLLYNASYERLGAYFVRPSDDVTAQGAINDDPLKVDTIVYPHVFEDSINYAQVARDEEHAKFIFPVSPKLRESLDSMLKTRVAAETKSFNDILIQVKEFECRDRQLPIGHPDKMVYEFEIGEPLYEFYVDYSRWPGRFFRGQRSFNRRTSNFYVETTPQIDITPPTCLPE